MAPNVQGLESAFSYLFRDIILFYLLTETVDHEICDKRPLWLRVTIIPKLILLKRATGQKIQIVYITM
jgi:hypothetical protein